MLWDDLLTGSPPIRGKAAACKQPPAAKNYNSRVEWADLSPDQLLRACARPDSTPAWEEFMQRYHPLITAAAIRVSNQWGNGSSDEIDDVIQEIYLGLCADKARVLTSFEETRAEAIFGYLKVVATNLARDFFRKRSAAKRGARVTASIDESDNLAGPGADLDRNLTLAKVDDLLVLHTQTENGARDRIIFRLYYRYGMTAQEIAELPEVRLSSKGVEGVLHRITRTIRQSLAQAQGIGGA
jgi:RNA polymerase sigma-70 factor (ECF subfamily)